MAKMTFYLGIGLLQVSNVVCVPLITVWVVVILRLIAMQYWIRLVTKMINVVMVVEWCCWVTIRLLCR